MKTTHTVPAPFEYDLVEVDRVIADMKAQGWGLPVTFTLAADGEPTPWEAATAAGDLFPEDCAITWRRGSDRATCWIVWGNGSGETIANATGPGDALDVFWPTIEG